MTETGRDVESLADELESISEFLADEGLPEQSDVAHDAAQELRLQRAVIEAAQEAWEHRTVTSHPSLVKLGDTLAYLHSQASDEGKPA